MAITSSFTTAHKATYPAIDPAQPKLSAKGKSAFVTGAGSGVGAAIAKSLARAGVSHLALVGRTEESLRETQAEIEGFNSGTKVSLWIADIVDAEAISAALKLFAQGVPSGKIDILIANAGYMSNLGSTVDSDPADFWLGFEVSVKGNFNLLRAFQPLAAPDASVIHVATAAIYIPFIPGFIGYRSSKAAATQMFQCFFAENPGFFGLHVHPGLIYGTAQSHKFEDLLNEAGYGEMKNDASLAGDFVAWAVSPEGRFLNGRFVTATWDVDELKAKQAELDSDPSLLTISLVE